MKNIQYFGKCSFQGPHTKKKKKPADKNMTNTLKTKHLARLVRKTGTFPTFLVISDRPQ